MNENLSKARIFAAGFGIAALVAAVAVGGYSLLRARSAVCINECRDWHTMTTLAVTSTVLAVLLLSLVLWAQLRDPSRRQGLTTATMLLGGAGAIGLFLLPLIANQFGRIGAATQAVPVVGFAFFAALAAVLTVVGVVALLLGEPALKAPSADRVWAGAGALLAVLVAVAAVGTVAPLADDARSVDATVATEADVQPIPPTLGQLHFHLRVGDAPASFEQQPVTKVFAAGAGFVVWSFTENKLTGYDPNGHERWHYLRLRPGAVWGVQAYGDDPEKGHDKGRTLVLELTNPHVPSRGNDSGVLIGLDANTGSQLWSSDDPLLYAAFNADHESRSLVARGAHRWTGFDARTGRQLWQVPNPLQCDRRDRPWGVVDSSAVVATVDNCSTAGERKFRLVTVDPRTGATLVTRDFATAPAGSKLTSMYLKSAGAKGAALTLNWATPPHASYPFVNVDTGVTAEISGAPQENLVGGDGDFLVPGSAYPDPVSAIYGADGVQRCMVPTGQGPQDSDSPGGWLGGEVVYFSYSDDRQWLRAADRHDCRITAEIPINPMVLWQILPTPGATVTVYAGEDGTYVDGYAP